MGRKRHPGTARTLTQSAYMDAAGRTYGLRVVTNFINPLWLSAVAGRAHHAVVLADGTVRVDGEPLVFAGESLPAGTEVRVTIHRDAACMRLDDWNRANALRKAQP